MRGGWARDVALLGALKLAACAIVLAAGFRAVSDDDFARVVIAEQWAHAPKLDPSGTSWLPAPFWVNGAAMLLFGRSLDVARAVAVTLGVASIVAVYLAARWMTGRRDAAIAGAALAAIFPWSARLGVATVPELPTAALTVLGMASCAAPTTGRLFVGAAALALASLSRYEVWPIAAGFAALVAVDACRRRGAIDGTERGTRFAAAALAVCGPLAWIAYNRYAHGDPLHFLARVTAYRRALGGAAEESALARIGAYPMRMLREEPELAAFAALLGVVVGARLGRTTAEVRARGVEAARVWMRPAVLALVQLVVLSLALVRDGAPTHHPERALLASMLLLAMAAGAFATAIGSDARSRAAAIACGLIAIGGGALVRGGATAEPLLARTDETAIGRDARALGGDARVLVEAPDYGYLAVVAALGHPEDAVVDRDIDPRHGAVPSSFDDPQLLARRVAGAGATYVVGRTSSIVAQAYGSARAVHGAWALWDAEPNRSAAR